MKEIFKPIPDYEGRYSVSSSGRVLGHPKKRKTGRGSSFYYTKEVILKEQTSRRGYKTVTLYAKDRKPKTFYVHRLVALVFIGKSDLQVNHKDLDKANNNINNLEFCDQHKNMAHARKHRRDWKNPRKKIFLKQKVQIKMLHILGCPTKDLATTFKISPTTVNFIKRT